MEPEWMVLNPTEYATAFEVGDQVVLATQRAGRLQATVAEIQSLFEPDRYGRTVYTGQTLDANVLPEGTITKFTSENSVKPIT
jgi:hypothetical protein